MFKDNKIFNQDIRNWDVSNGTNFSAMFLNAKTFNQPLNNWNVSNGTDFRDIFNKAKSFNQPLNNWIINKNVIVKKLFDEFNIEYYHLPRFIYNLDLLNIGFTFIPKKIINTNPDLIYIVDNKILFLNYKDNYFNGINFNDILNLVYFEYKDNLKKQYFFLINKNEQEYYYKIEKKLFNDMINKNIITKDIYYK